MADHHKTAVVVDQRFFQNAQRRKIQVVGRLVENQEIAAAAQNFGKRQTRFLAAGKIFDFRVDPVVFKQKTLQMQLPVTSVTLALRLKRLADFSIFCFPEDVLLLQSHSLLPDIQ